VTKVCKYLKKVYNISAKAQKSMEKHSRLKEEEFKKMLKEDIKRKEVIKNIKINKINAVKELQLKYEQKAQDLKRRLSLQSASYDDDLNAMLFKIETQRNALFSQPKESAQAAAGTGKDRRHAIC
jgi:thioester reductase-like protein